MFFCKLIPVYAKIHTFKDHAQKVIATLMKFMVNFDYSLLCTDTIFLNSLLESLLNKLNSYGIEQRDYRIKEVQKLILSTINKLPISLQKNIQFNNAYSLIITYLSSNELDEHIYSFILKTKILSSDHDSQTIHTILKNIFLESICNSRSDDEYTNFNGSLPVGYFHKFKHMIQETDSPRILELIIDWYFVLGIHTDIFIRDIEETFGYVLTCIIPIDLLFKTIQLSSSQNIFEYFFLYCSITNSTYSLKSNQLALFTPTEKHTIILGEKVSKAIKISSENFNWFLSREIKANQVTKEYNSPQDKSATKYLLKWLNKENNTSVDGKDKIFPNSYFNYLRPKHYYTKHLLQHMTSNVSKQTLDDFLDKSNMHLDDSSEFSNLEELPYVY